MSGSTRRVALIYDPRRAYDLKVMTGVAAYFQENRHKHGYSLHIEEDAWRDPRRPLRGDGIISSFDDPAMADRVAQSRLPTVAFGCGSRGPFRESSIPYFCTNSRAIARLAADHLLARAFRYFAYCGYAPTPSTNWSREREEAFVQYVKQRGSPCAVFRARRHRSDEWAAAQRRLGEWLRRLPKPVGVMVAHDDLGRQVLEACRADDLCVPHDVAVVGVDNDELQCLLSSPPMSSVEQGARGLGYAAAALLDEIIRGATPRKWQFTTEPMVVVTRQSTDVLATADAKVAEAMAFIQAHACEGIKVPHVAAAAAMSRSALEKRFASVLGCTIRMAIRRTQLDRARWLVLETDRPLKQIAAETGFRSVPQMTALFARAFGVTPGRSRLQSSTKPRLPVLVEECLSIDLSANHRRTDGRSAPNRDVMAPVADCMPSESLLSGARSK